MKLNFAFLSILIALVFNQYVFAQENKNFCGHDIMQAKHWEQDPKAKADYLELIERARTFESFNGKKRTKFIIPVVFHVIHNDGEENLPDSYFAKQLKVLNDDFQKLNFDTSKVDPTYKELIANCGFEFRLATKDPNNNCTSGINHIKSHLTNKADNYSKLNQWNRNNYLNIWVVKSIYDPNLAGYSQLPSNVKDDYSFLYYADGVIILADQIKNANRVLTHEIGHYLGLPHTFNSYLNSNKTGFDCGDDFIDDTPRTKGGSYNSCFLKPSNAFGTKLCDFSEFSLLNSFDGVSKNSGNIVNKNNIGVDKNFKINFEVNNYVLDTTFVYGTVPFGARNTFKYKNLSSLSSLKNKIAHTQWPMGGINKDTTTSKYKDSLNLNKYYEFDYISSNGISIDLKGLKLFVSRNQDGVKSITVRSSLDNFQSNIPFSSDSKFVRNINNVVNYKEDTISQILLKYELNDSRLNDFRDKEKITFRIYGWNAESKNGSLIIDSISLVGYSTKVNLGSFSAQGVSKNSIADGKLAFNMWGIGGKNKDSIITNQTGNIDLTKYYEFKTSTYKHKLATLDSITFVVNRNLTGVKNFSIKSSSDNFKNDLAVKTNYKGVAINFNKVFIKSDTNISFKVNVSLNSSDFKDLREDKELTFRIYAWNAENQDGTFEVDSVNLFGVASTIENVDNFMDYTNCNRMFTKGQASLMTAILSDPESIRYDLHQDSNLKNTGTDIITTPVCGPKAYFTSSMNYICEGESIVFNDKSWNSGVTERQWYFEDGIPSTSIEQNPTIIFNKPGYKKVTLKVKNSIDEDSLVIEKAIYVNASETQIKGLIGDDFNQGINNNWLIENEENNFASFNSGTGRWGTKGLKLNIYKDVSDAKPYDTENYFYYNRLRESKDAIITPSIDFSILSETSLNFDYAYATSSYYDSLITEKIEVSYTDDCGKTWKPIHTICYNKSFANTTSISTDLVTAGIFGGKEFVPTSDEIWKTTNINLNQIKKDKNVRLKIEFTASNNSNNLYIDNINISGAVSVDENPLNKMSFEINPNPTTNDKGINIEYIANEKPVSFELIDLQGKLLTREINSNTNGTISHTIKLNSNLEAGYYILKISQGEYVFNKKVIIQ